MRAAFDAHGIHVAINAEQHASMLGGLGGAFVPLHITVAEEDAEEATALLADLRKQDDGELPDELREGTTEADGADGADGADDADGVDDRVYRRRRTAIAIGAGVCLTFGMAHISTGAYFRGMTLAGVEAFGVRMLFADAPNAWLVIGAAIAADLIGALWRIRGLKTPPPPSRLPGARIHR